MRSSPIGCCSSRLSDWTRRPPRRLPLLRAPAGVRPAVVVTVDGGAVTVTMVVCVLTCCCVSVTVTVLVGAICVIVDDGGVVVTVTMTDSDGGAGDVSAGAVGVVRVAVERVCVVESVRVDVRVPLAALLPPPHDESAKPPSATRIPAVATLRWRARCDAPLALTCTSRILSRRSAVSARLETSVRSATRSGAHRRSSRG